LLGEKMLAKAKASARAPPKTDSLATSIDSAIGRFVLGTAGATLVVLCVCSDDVIWLLAFLGGKDRGTIIAFYMFTMVLMWALSFLVVLVVMLFSLEFAGADVVEWAMVVSAIFLSLLTLKFLHDYLSGHEEVAGEGKKETHCEIVNLQRNTTTAAQQAETHETADEVVEASNRGEGAEATTPSKSITRSLCNLFLVSIAGNVDNIAIYITILLNETFTSLELLLGTIIAGGVVSALTMGLSHFEVIMKFVSRLPLWVIIGLLAGYVWGSVLTHVSTV
jgi:hypothetical protein